MSPATTMASTAILTSHLTPARWAAANRHLVRKAIAEFSHERLLAPKALDSGVYHLESDDGGTEYRFSARLLKLDHWSIDAASITRTIEGQEHPLDALEFIMEFRLSLGIPGDMLPVYLEEISSTLAGYAYKNAAGPAGSGAPLSSNKLAAGITGESYPAEDFQAIERSMTEGHPCFVANNGRLGFGIGDYHAYAPETGAPVQLHWLAVHRDNAVFSSTPLLSYRKHLESELGTEMLSAFDAMLEDLGLAPSDYLFMPVHPWQWENKLAVTFAAELAQRRIVHLGTGDDTYQAQQSIRTFFNRNRPDASYIKTALSVLNMGFMRGLSPEYMRATPAINDWVHNLVHSDDTLQHHGFSILRETAAVGYHNHYYEATAESGSPYRKMLSALWRESPLPSLESGQQLATMASLLHRDAAGDSFVSALIDRSGMDAADWLRQYLDAYLVPLLHCFYRHELVYMPHGENLILVLRDGIPERAIMKDIGEEIAFFGDASTLPGDVARIRVEVPDGEKILSIFTDVFDCFFRFLAATLDEDGRLEEKDFWRTVAAVVVDYQGQHPELAEAFAKYDLFADEFELSCLNRLQLRNNQQMVDLAGPSGALQKSGVLGNPVAGFSGRRRSKTAAA
nr:IucA/IucC family siderophore biosynthesis protein [Arthrobacter sp. H14]